MENWKIELTMQKNWYEMGEQCRKFLCLVANNKYFFNKYNNQMLTLLSGNSEVDGAYSHNSFRLV